MKKPWVKVTGACPVCDECEEAPFDAEHERVKMLKLWSTMAMLGIIGMFVSVGILAPDAFPVTAALAWTAGMSGYVVGRYIQRQGIEVGADALQDTRKILKSIEGDFASRLAKAHEEHYRLMEKNSKLARSVEDERTARVAAQRKLVLHVRDCDGPALEAE